MNNVVRKFIIFLGSIISLPFLFTLAFFARMFTRTGQDLRLVWGSTPIINYSHWSKAMSQAGFKSETLVVDFYHVINERSDWDRVLKEEYIGIPNALKKIIAFAHSLYIYDVFFISCDGFLIGNSSLRFYQALLFKLAGKKTVVLPYGSDGYVYRNVRSPSLVQALLLSYPDYAKQQDRIEKNISYWVKHADAFVPAFMGADGFGRWDVLVPNALSLDLCEWRPSRRKSSRNGKNGRVVIAHAPNHKGFKGTEFISNAVNKLRDEGLDVELVLLERLKNSEVRRFLHEDTDILVEQLIFTGHGLSALEGMASGVAVVSNLESEEIILPFRRWSYFNECPLVSASPETIEDILRVLVTRPNLRKQLGRAGRQYTEKYHGLDSAAFLFSNILRYVFDEQKNILDVYHPLVGEYPNRSSKIQHPLVNSKIVDQ